MKTCRELGVNLWAYLQARVRGTAEIPRLAALIRLEAEGIGQEGRGRAAGVGEWRRGGVNAEAIALRKFGATPAPPTEPAPRVPRVIEKLPFQRYFV